MQKKNIKEVKSYIMGPPNNLGEDWGVCVNSAPGLELKNKNQIKQEHDMYKPQIPFYVVLRLMNTIRSGNETRYISFRYIERNFGMLLTTSLPSED